MDFSIAIGARGLAMALNRIIDRDIDASNPRTANRHLVSSDMSMQTAWSLSAIFLAMLLVGAWQLNEVALMMAWLPVLVFVVYPYTKRYTWLCHFWLGPLSRTRARWGVGGSHGRRSWMGINYRIERWKYRFPLVSDNFLHIPGSDILDYRV